MNTQVSSPDLRAVAQDSNASAPSVPAMSHLLRRLDWRFLLPDPCLGDVAYVGPVSGALFEALKVYSRSFMVLDPIRHPVSPAVNGVDVVVLCKPNIDLVRVALELVRVGGSFYIETRSHSICAATSDGAAGGLRLITRQAYRNGFRDVQVHWHRPDFEDCVEIISMRNTRPAQYLYSRRAANLAAKLKVWIGLVLLRRGLLRSANPCFSIIGTRSDRGRKSS
jgi:hypothetical protein